MIRLQERNETKQSRLRTWCYWFVDGNKIADYYDRLVNGETIILDEDEFSGKTKKLATSGSTTGSPTLVEVCKEQLELRFAAELYTMSWTRWKPGNRWAHLWYPTVREHLDSKWRIFKKKLAQRLDNCLFMSYFNLNGINMRTYYNKIVLFQPKLLVGYSEALYIFANFLIENWLLDVYIPDTISSGGQLYPEWRTKIEHAFHTQVWNRYGCSEFGVIAQEDWRDGSGLMKIIVQRGLVVRQGENNQFLITDLNNRYGARFVDYDLGDTGRVENNVMYELNGKIKSGRSYLRIY